MQGKPIQIISIGNEDDTSGSRCILELNEAELIPLLMDEKVKDRDVCVISVAGAFRKGKSFLLDFFLRYMYARYVDGNVSDNDWLGGDEEPLKGFSWRGGSKRDTTGILLWSDIFLYDYPTGEKVAIILMDTQGTFDCESTMKDCANVFALSTMISSVQIFNIQSNIQKDDLQHLQLFTEYARIAMEDTGKKPFQKLQFLIRDWPNEFETPYGAIGGKLLLETILNSKEKRHEENEQLCENLKTSFDEINCYLMPHPGLTVQKPDFQGCLKDLQDDFKKHLLDLIPLILAPENLIIKEINGEKLKVAHLLEYIQLYFESFNSKDFPEPTTIFKATAEANNQIHATNAEELYNIKMKQLTAPDQPYIDEAELKKKHEEYMSQSISDFENKPIMGRAKFIQKYYNKIKNYASSHFTQFAKINEAKLALAELNYLNDKNSCIRSFEKAMDDFFIGEAYTPLDEFKKIMENVKSKILQKFDSKRTNSTEKIHTRIRKELVEDLDKLYTKYNHQNEMKLASIKSYINMECAEAKKLYDKLMNNSEQSIEALTKAHAGAKKQALEMFRKVPHVGAEDFFKDCENQLIEKTDKKFNSIKECIVNKQQYLQLQFSQLKMNYENLMKEVCKKVLTNDNLLSKHEEFKGKVLEEFDDLTNNGKSVNYMVERRQKLDEDIEEIFDYYKSKNDKSLNEFVQKCISTKRQAKNVLMEPLENLSMFDSVDDVNSTYNRAFNEALDLYMELQDLISFNQETFDEYLSELREEFEAELQMFTRRAEVGERVKNAAKTVLLTVVIVGFVAIFKVPPPI
ncbi:atlastin [Zeugodacus cucurbitae]|uniref:atlastin n=1 Tax=Zeugodacus cucurbitae TaxID=28588 RepID=UPI0005969B18|nr:atlastin [Zeugodacus cucurbitae]